jgi:hypothetical protein
MVLISVASSDLMRLPRLKKVGIVLTFLDAPESLTNVLLLPAICCKFVGVHQVL